MRSREIRRPSDRSGRTSASMVVRLAAGNALLQPRSGGALGLEVPPAAIGMQVDSDFIALLSLQPVPLSVEVGGESRYGINWRSLHRARAHPQELLASVS